MSTKPFYKYQQEEPRPSSGFEKYLYRDLVITVNWIKRYCAQRGEECPYCHWHHPTEKEDCKEYPPGQKDLNMHKKS